MMIGPVTRKGRPDALNPTTECRWLVVRNHWGRVIHWEVLPQHADLRGAMAAHGAFRQAEGWVVEEIPHNCAFFFCSRGNERICVAIECYEPGKAPTGHGSVIGH